MPFGINSNISALGVQRHLEQSQGELNTSIARLSSGLRINQARDDAAGMAIVDRMTANIRGNAQSIRNVNDGISLLQTADGALTVMTDNVQRIRELAVQAANETNTVSDRRALQSEVYQLIQANRQIGLETEFNGQKLLDGSFQNMDFQVGAAVEDKMRISLGAAVNPQTSGLVLMPVQFYQKVLSGTVVTAPLNAGDLRIDGTAIGASVAGAAVLGRSSASAWAIANAINAATLPAIASVTASTDVNGVTISVPGGGATMNAGALTINGQSVGGAAGGDAATFGANVKAAIDGAGAGVTATVQVIGSQVRIGLNSADGGDISVGGNSSVVAAGVYKGIVTITSKVAQGSTANIVIAGAHPDKAGFISGNYQADPSGAPVPTLVPVSTSGDLAVSLLTTDDASAAIRYADDKLGTLADIRTTVGAEENRMSSALQTITLAVTNMSAARSRVQDTDYAQETAKLTRAQILQQAGRAMLAQANVTQGNVLALLR
jgi:flagellin